MPSLTTLYSAEELAEDAVRQSKLGFAEFDHAEAVAQERLESRRLLAEAYWSLANIEDELRRME